MGHERPGILFAEMTRNLALENASQMQTFIRNRKYPEDSEM